jgi:hypothetical protein
MSGATELLSLAKNPTTGQVTEFFGPTVEFLTSPEDEHNDFCVLKGTIPPGMSVPLHAHADTEDFLVISGSVEALSTTRKATPGSPRKREISFMCRERPGTPGATSPGNRWLT